MDQQTAPAPAGGPQSAAATRTFVLAGGCFWCLDAVYRRMRGVVGVVSGYTGGHTPAPHYHEVCSGTSGHAEAVAVTFDESVLPADVVLDVFFATHDPTTLDRQGYDVGPQYRSAMFYHDEGELDLFRGAIQRNQRNWADPIVTRLERASRFHEAESEHQDFYRRNPWSGYCQVIINPKLAKARKHYAAWLEE